VVALVIWLLVDNGDDSSSTTTTGAGTGPIGLSAADLRSTAQGLGQPVYWAGPKSGYTYEYTQTSNGTVYVRYLPSGAPVGDPASNYLIVATYPFADALAALKEVSHGKGTNVPGGGLALVDQGYPNSVHMAFPGVDYQVEVFDPSPRKSRNVATSGNVAPVG
jgi:hypothetical protein